MKITNLPRIYFSTRLITNTTINLTKEYTFYLTHVLRMRINSKVRVFNEMDGEFLAEVINISNNNLTLKLNKILRQSSKRSNTTKVTLALALIKSDKMLDAIDMSVQLGVDEILPIITTRSQMKVLNEQKIIKRIIEATEQSERLTLTKLQQPIKLTNYINSNHLVLYANENEQYNNTILEIYTVNRALFLLPITIIIGPEGGFTNDELEFLSSLNNSYGVSLSPYILRTETAVAAALAQLSYINKDSKDI